MKKAELRNELKLMRGNMPKDEAEKKSDIICQNFINSDLYKNARVIALYISIKNEVNLKKLIKRAFKDGKRVLVPITDKAKKEIYLSEIYINSDFENGDFNIPEPVDKSSCQACDVMLVPGIAFTRMGERIGWGGGFYDRLIEKTDTVTVGVCYDFQIVEKIKKEPHDFSMDYILSESEMVLCE